VKTPGDHFQHVIFRQVGAILGELSAVNDLLAHLRRTRREFSHGLDPKQPVRPLASCHSDRLKRT
jgi:hypothetical protein